MKKRILSILLVMLTVLALVPPGTAQAARIVARGECGAEGDNVTWTLDSDGTLTISGTGEMRQNHFSGTAPWSDFCSAVKKVVIEKGVSTIANGSFYMCENLSQVSIPNSVVTIGQAAFKYCKSLKQINLPAGVSLDWSVFSESGLRSVVIPDGVTSIPSDAFSYCTSLTTVVLPSTLTKIESTAFFYCTSLSNVAIPPSVTSIGRDAFFHCTKLTDVQLPEKLTSLEMFVFGGCTSLKSVYIPASITRVCINTLSAGTTPFYDCSSLTEIRYGGTTAQWNDIIVFCNLPSSPDYGKKFKLSEKPFYLANSLSVIHCTDGDIVNDTPVAPSPSPAPTLGPLPHPTASPSPSPSPTAGPVGADASGTCGSLLWWVRDKVLTISGKGEMPDFSYKAGSLAPWAKHSEIIWKVVVEDGITTMGEYALFGLNKCREVTLGKDIDSVKKGGLAACESGKLDIIFTGRDPKNIDEAAFSNAEVKVTVYCATNDHFQGQWKYFGFNSNTGVVDRSKNVEVRWVRSNGPHKDILAKNGFFFVNDNSEGVGFQKPKGYYISKADYDRLTRNLTDTEKNSVSKAGLTKMFLNVDGKEKHYAEWEGSCYGMSAAVASVLSHALSASAAPGTPKSLSELRMSKEVQSFVNFYNVQQKLKAVKDEETAGLKSRSHADQIKWMEEVVKERQDTGALISFDFYQNKEKHAHTVVGYAVEEGTFPMEINGKTYVFNNRILTYDPAKNGSGQDNHTNAIYYNYHPENVWAIPGWGAISTAKGLKASSKDNTAQLTGITFDRDYINAVDYATGVRSYVVHPTSAPAYIIPGYIYTSSQNFDLTINGRTENIRDGLFDGNTTISASGAQILFSRVGNGDGSYAIALPEGAAYTVSAKDRFACSLETDDYYMDVAADRGGTASFTPGGKVTLDLAAPGSGNLGVTANDSPTSWHNFVLSGGDASHLEAELSDKGLLFSGDLEKAEVTAYEEEDDSQHLKFSTKEGSVLVTEQGRTLALRADKDGDGNYTDPIESFSFTVFTDVDPAAWYAEAVEYVYTNGIMNGVSGSRFAPNSTTTRGMVVTVLHRMQGTPSPSPAGLKFSDVDPEQWYSSAVAWAAGEEIVRGIGQGRFAPDSPITREQLALILYNYAGREGVDTTRKANYSNFSDSASVSNWARDAIAWAVGTNLINGKNGKLAPGDTATRAEIATILMRYCTSFA